MSLRHHSEHLHRIPQATHLLYLCCHAVMSRGSMSFNFSHFSSVYVSCQIFFERTKSLCDWDFTGKIYFFYRVSFSPSLYKVLCVPAAILGHYISFSMLLHQTMTSPFSNCFQMRQGLSFHSLFHFLDQALAARAQVRADYQTRYMISCRQSTWRKTSCDQVSRKQFIHLPFPLLSFLCSLFSFSLHWENTICDSSDNFIIILHLWESTW